MPFFDRFINTDPTAASFSSGMDRLAREHEFDRQRAQEEGIDQAYRQGLGEMMQRPGSNLASLTVGTEGGQTPPIDPVLSRLVNTPGAGREAFQYQQTMQGDRDRDERMAVEALGRGDMDIYRHYAQRAGLQIPEEVLADRELSSRFAAGALLAEKFYGSTPQAHRFMQAYMESDGNPQAAWAAAGPPQRSGNAARPSLETIMVENQRVYARWNPQTNQLEPVMGPNGQPAIAPPTGTGRYGGPTASDRVNAYQAATDALGQSQDFLQMGVEEQEAQRQRLMDQILGNAATAGAGPAVTPPGGEPGVEWTSGTQFGGSGGAPPPPPQYPDAQPIQPQPDGRWLYQLPNGDQFLF